jgi:hypothetical protein
MILLVLGMPIVVLVMALALARLETALLPPRGPAPVGRDGAVHEPPTWPTRPSPGPGDVRGVEPFTAPRGTSHRPSA